MDCRRKRPKSRTKVTAHPQDSYEHYLEVARDIHGVTDESCCICGRPRSEGKKHDREHDHKTGNPRGIACFRCNRELLRHADLEQARQVTAYLERVEAYYAGDAVGDRSLNEPLPSGHADERRPGTPA